MSKGLQIALGAAAIAMLLGWYGASQIQGDGLSFQYFQNLEEFHANRFDLGIVDMSHRRSGRRKLALNQQLRSDQK